MILNISRVYQMEKYVWTQIWPSFPPDNTLSAPSILLVHISGQPHVWIQQVTVQIEKQQGGESSTRRESRWNLRRILKKDHFQRVQPYPIKDSVIVIFVNVNFTATNFDPRHYAPQEKTQLKAITSVVQQKCDCVVNYAHEIAFI